MPLENHLKEHRARLGVNQSDLGKDHQPDRAGRLFAFRDIGPETGEDLSDKCGGYFYISGGRGMKNRESFIKLLLLAVIGAMIGVSGNILLRFSGEGIKGIYAEMGAALRHTGWKIESLLILVVMAVLIGIYRHLRSLWAQEEASEDETADLCGEQFERWAQTGIVIANTAVGFFIVFGCLAFPGNVEDISQGDGVKYLLLAAVMVFGCIAMAVMEILFYHLMQKRDPSKKGDPVSFNFDKRWLEGCDETEKLVLYQAGYRAFNSMQIVMLIGIILAVFGKMQFGTGDFPLILLGFMWVIGMLNFGIWKMKGLRKNRT